MAIVHTKGSLLNAILYPSGVCCFLGCPGLQTQTFPVSFCHVFRYFCAHFCLFASVIWYNACQCVVLFVFIGPLGTPINSLYVMQHRLCYTCIEVYCIPCYIPFTLEQTTFNGDEWTHEQIEFVSLQFPLTFDSRRSDFNFVSLPLTHTAAIEQEKKAWRFDCCQAEHLFFFPIAYLFMCACLYLATMYWTIVRI